jgi:hypothetical protein
MQTIEIKKTSGEAKKERTYPYMGISDKDNMVWFTGVNTGIAIRGGSLNDRTKIGRNWNEKSFTPMQGEYTFNFENK